VTTGKYAQLRNEIQEHRFCAKEAVSLLWEVRKLLMLLIAPGVDSVVCFNASMCPDCSTNKCSWCLVMAVVQHNAVD
jgi:hypothetical protein